MGIADDILAAITANDEVQRDSTGMLLGKTAEQSSLTGTIADLIGSKGANDTIIAAQKNAADLSMQTARIQAANIFGTDISKQTEALSTLNEQANKAYADRDTALQDIQKKQSTTIFENPLEYLLNKFTINQDIARHNAADQRITNAEDRIAKLNSATQSTIVTNNQLGESLTAATQEAATRNVAILAEQEVAKVKIAGIGYNIQGISDVSKWSQKKLDNTFSYANALNAQQGIQNALAQLSLSQEKFEHEKVEFGIKQQNIQDQKQFDMDAVTKINKGIEALTGGKGTSLNDVTGRQALALMKGNSPLADKFFKYYQAGENSMIAGVPIIAPSIGQAADVLGDKNINVQLVPAQLAVKTIVDDSVAEFKRRHGEMNLPESKIDLKDKNTVAAAITKIGNEITEAKASNIKPLDGTNPFNIGSLNGVADNSEVVRNLPVWKTVFEPLTSKGLQLTDPKQVVQLTAEAIADKKITYQEALEITTIFQQGTALNAAARQFQSMGITPRYSYRSEAPSTLTGRDEFGIVDSTTDIIDYTKPDQVSRILGKLLSQKLQVGQRYTPFGTQRTPQTSQVGQIPD